MLDVSFKKNTTDLASLKLMGILNATPDSFFDKGSYFSQESAIARAKQMEELGVDIIDIGGESTRPSADIVQEEEEIRRIRPIFEALKNNISVPLSIDTSSPKVASLAVSLGASLINDVRGFQDPKMQEVAASCDADLCVMHMQGSPQSRYLDTSYPEGIIPHLMNWFEKQIKQLTALGIEESRIILDPGIGFGKTVEQTLCIIKNLAAFKSFGMRILIGASRKSFMGKILGKPSTELLPATLAIHTISLLAGADIIRAHDVSEHRDLLAIVSRLTSSSL